MAHPQGGCFLTLAPVVAECREWISSGRRRDPSFVGMTLVGDAAVPNSQQPIADSR